MNDKFDVVANIFEEIELANQWQQNFVPKGVVPDFENKWFVRNGKLYGVDHMINYLRSLITTEHAKGTVGFTDKNVKKWRVMLDEL